MQNPLATSTAYQLFLLRQTPLGERPRKPFSQGPRGRCAFAKSERRRPVGSISTSNFAATTGHPEPWLAGCCRGTGRRTISTIQTMNKTTKGLQVGAEIRTLPPMVRCAMYDQLGEPEDDQLRWFSDEVCGTGGVALAIRHLCAGSGPAPDRAPLERVRLVRARRDDASGKWHLVDQVWIGYEANEDPMDEDESYYCRPEIRWCDEDGDVRGHGSHSVVSYSSPTATDPTHVACEVVEALTLDDHDLMPFWVKEDAR